ncbi:pumilio protein [Lotmaria passim]
MSGANWDLGVGTRPEDLDWGAAPDGEDMFSAQADDLLIADPRDVRRAETAPMVLTIMGSDGTFSLGAMEEEKIDPEEEYRYTEEYHRLYYSKNPRDPRMLPPLTRRRHYLTREARNTAAEDTGFAVTSGVVGDGVQSGAAKATGNDSAATMATAANATAPAKQDEQAIAQALVSAYIEGFRSDWDYPKIKGYVCSFSKDQDGSRLVQRLLEKQENIVPIFNEVIDKFDELATDVFGNYVLQKLFDVVPRAENDPSAPAAIAEAKMLSRLTDKVRGHLVQLSCQTYGCRVMQKALENMRAADRASIIHELDGKVVECVFDQNANHVVQKVVEVCPADAQFIIDEFIPDLGDLACHAYGCRVLQRTFEKCHDVPGVNVRPLMEAVLIRVSEFAIHQYGNYVVQHAMVNAPSDLRHRFVLQLAPQLYALSCSKFASNVAERIVTTATEEERDEIIQQLKKPLSDAQRGNYLILMMQDTYANYVVQRFFEAVSPSQRERVSEIVQPFVGNVNQSIYGRHLLRKMVTNNILTNAFLLDHGIDVSSPEYGGSMSQNGGRGDRGGRHSSNNSNNNQSYSGANGVSGGRSSSNTNTTATPMNANVLSSSSSNNNVLGHTSNGMQPNMQGGFNNTSSGNPGTMMMQPAMAPPQFQQAPSMNGYMAAAAAAPPTAVAAAPQQFSYRPVYSVAQPNQQQALQQQQQQQQLQSMQPMQPQPFMGNASQMPPPQPFMPTHIPQSSQFLPTQIPASNGQYNFSVYSTQPQVMAPQHPQPQPGYTMQSFSMPQPQQQPFRQDNTWTTQAFMNGGYGDADQQQQQPFGLQKQQPMFQGGIMNGNGFMDGTMKGRCGKDSDAARSAKRMAGEQFAASGMSGSNNHTQLRRPNYTGQRTQQQLGGY